VTARGGSEAVVGVDNAALWTLLVVVLMLMLLLLLLTNLFAGASLLVLQLVLQLVLRGRQPDDPSNQPTMHLVAATNGGS
jgi:hypothetical protein